MHIGNLIILLISVIREQKDIFMHTFYYKMKHGAISTKWSKSVCVNTYICIYSSIYTYILLVHGYFLPDAVRVLAAVRVWQLSCAVWVFIILL